MGPAVQRRRGLAGRTAGRSHAHSVLAGGAVISLLLAALYLTLASARNRAWRLVEARTRELRQSEERFRTPPTNVSTEWYWEQDRDRFTGFIGKAREATAVPSDHFMGRTRWDSRPKSMSEAQWAAHRADLRRGDRSASPIRCAIPRGMSAGWRPRASPRFDEGGAFIGYHGTAREITRQVETEHRLIRVTALHMNQGISVVDAELKMVGCNRRFIELLGFPEALSRDGTPFEDFVRAYNAERGEYVTATPETLVRAERVELARHFLPHRFKRSRPDGTVIDVPHPHAARRRDGHHLHRHLRTGAHPAGAGPLRALPPQPGGDLPGRHLRPPRRGHPLRQPGRRPPVRRGAAGGFARDRHRTACCARGGPQVRERIESLVTGRLAQTPLTKSAT